MDIHLDQARNVIFMETVSMWNGTSENIIKKNTHKNLYQVEDFNISDIFLQKSKTLSNDQFIQ